MHELSIALSLIETASAEAERRGGARVRAIHITVGPLSGVVVPALESAFRLAREGTPLEGAGLAVRTTSVTAHCPACNAPRSVRSIQCMQCAVCGEPATDVLTGRELDVTALEIAQ